MSSSALMIELLAWVQARPRTFSEAMEAWRTSCPRMPIWEDAVMGGLLEIQAADSGRGGPTVKLTETGRALLAESAEQRTSLL